MKIFVAAAVGLVMTAGWSSAQSAGEAFDAEGLAAFTQLELAMGNELRRAGVPEECLRSMPMGSVQKIAAYMLGEEDEHRRNAQVQLMLELVCGDIDMK